jgi:pimeloyl-ACP methyl ester carboxylesterase
MDRRALRLARNIASLVVVLAVVLVVAGISYQTTEKRIDARRFPEAGRLVDIGGYRLNINCTGQGSPTVVLESGLATLSLGWQRVQSGIAEFTRVCSYDRAGYAWSDASPRPRTSVEIAKELHILLGNAGERPPYVLVGHSFGGLDIRAYNGLYPNEVVGMVLPESTHPDLLDRLPPSIKKLSDNAQSEREREVLWAPFLYGLGITRFLRRKVIDDPNAPRGEREYAYLSMPPKFNEAVTREAGALEESGAQVKASGTLGDKPLIVLTAEKGGLSGEGKDFEYLRGIWINDLQLQLTHLSTRGQRVMVPDSDHMIPFERPDVIVNAVREVCATANAK